MVKLFDRRQKAIKTCFICGLEKEMTWNELADHIKEHIKNGDVVSNTIAVSYTHLTLPTTPYV